MKVAQAIARAREAKGLSQVELAKRLGVSPGTVGSWEAGDHGVRISRLKQVAKALDIEVTELLG